MKYLKKKEAAKLPLILIGIAFAVVLGLLGWLVLKGSDAPPDEDLSVQDTTLPTGQSDESTDTTEATVPALELPYVLEYGKLTVDSVFQFEGLNPDRQDEWAEGVAAILLTNTSKEHLASLTVTVVTAEGTTVTFKAYDIPSGMSAMLMSPDNTPVENDPDCAQMTCEAVFQPESPLAADQLVISVIGTEITVENISGRDLSDITVYCHSMLDQSCYGGTVYPYMIDSLPAGESTVINAWECYLGMVKVVRVEVGTEFEA